MPFQGGVSAAVLFGGGVRYSCSCRCFLSHLKTVEVDDSEPFCVGAAVHAYPFCVLSQPINC